MRKPEKKVTMRSYQKLIGPMEGKLFNTPEAIRLRGEMFRMLFTRGKKHARPR